MKMDPLKPEDTERLFAEIMPEPNRREFEEDRDTDFAYEIPGVARFRVNIYHDRQGAAGAFRLIPTEVMTAEDLGLPSAIMQFCKLPKGLVLVTGPTGSGKSTTLAAMLDSINASRAQHIITIEDPIEFVHHSKKCLVHQREIGTQVKSFGRALRAALREDPDVVLVGEMRDLETAHIAIETAETGHLVFGTLHTTSAVSTVDRIIDQFPVDQQEQIRIMLSESLKAVIAQVLCKKIGGGRVAALEVLMVNPAVSNLIREAKTFQIPSIMQTGKKLGMVTLNDALLELVQKKTIEPREAYVTAIDKPNLVSQFKARNVRLDFLEPGGHPPQG
jgi:twitching motility protein PilT